MSEKAHIDYTNVDYLGFKQQSIETLQEKIPEYTDTSETDAGIAIIEAVAKGLDVISFYQNAQANECFLTTAEQRSNVLKFSKMLGYTPRPHTPSKYLQYFRLRKGAGIVVVPKGTIIRTSERDLDKVEYFTTLKELRVNTSTALSVIRETAGYVDTFTVDDEEFYIFSVDIAHGVLIDNEVVGSGDGVTPKQKFTLFNSPVCLPDYDNDGYALQPRRVEGTDYYTANPDGYDEARRIQVMVAGEEWTLKNSFVDSKSTSKDYTVEVGQDNTVTLIFGDGYTGKIPSGEISVSYRKGGGTVGNTGAMTITVMPQPIDGVEEVYNPDSAYSEGTDKETLASIKVNAPNSFRTKWACIEDTDYASKVLELFTRVFIASSFSLTKHPLTNEQYKDLIYKSTGESLTGTDLSNYILDTVQICVVLTGDILRPDGHYKKLADFRKIEDAMGDLGASILSELEERAMLGTHQILTSFDSKMVTLYSVLRVKDGYDYDTVKSKVANLLSEQFVIGQIAAGATVSLNELEAIVYDKIDGVRAFRIQSYSVGDDPTQYDELDIPSELWEIIELDDEATENNIAMR